VHRSREWLFERIRRAQREQGLSGRELAAPFKVSRNTVQKALESPVPPKRKSPPPRKSVLEPVKGFIDAMLREDLDAPAKQKHTIPRIMERLAAEHDFELARSTTVYDYVDKRRPQAARKRWRAGATWWAWSRRRRTRARRQKSTSRTSGWTGPGSAAGACCSRYGCPTRARRSTGHATASQEAFLDGHVEAFTVLGGVPSVHIRYDNLKPAVKQVLFGRSRLESSRWASFKSW